MSVLDRRGLLAGLGAMLAMPAIIRTPGLLMPVVRPLLPVVDRHAIVIPLDRGTDDGLLPADVIAAITRGRGMFVTLIRPDPRMPAWVAADRPYVYEKLDFRDYGPSRAYTWTRTRYERA